MLIKMENQKMDIKKIFQRTKNQRENNEIEYNLKMMKNQKKIMKFSPKNGKFNEKKIAIFKKYEN